MKLSEIQDLIKFVSRSGVNEVEIEHKDFKILIKSDYMAKKKSNLAPDPVIHQAPVAQAQQMVPQVVAPLVEVAPAAIAVPVEEENAHYITVKSQMIGTFYRSSSPDKPSFVEVGDVIKEGDPICIVEAMKLFNEIESEVSGKIVKVLVDDATPVEFDQPLFLVDPS